MKILGGLILILAAFLSCGTLAAAEVPQAQKKLPGWADYMDSLRPVADRILPITAAPNDDQERQELSRVLMATLAQGFIAHVYADPDNPEFMPIYSPALNLWAPNPDYKYSWTPIYDGGVYRISGYRGTVHFAELSFLGGFYPLNGLNARSLASLDLDSLKLGKDGAFSVIVSARRPDGYDGDWWQMPAGAKDIVTRSASYDWANERDARLAIQRVDVAVSAPRLTAEQLSQRLQELTTWTEQGVRIPIERAAEMIKANRVNQVKLHDESAFGGVIGQLYYEGLYKLNKGEALIVETEVPKTCRYWGILVADDQFITIDWMNRQSSLNAFQAHIDADGKFRAVISNEDPGVPNWLDAGDHTFGIIQGRWNNCSSTPTPSAKKVALSELRKYLPKDTPHVSPAERRDSLDQRRRADQLRRQ